MLDLSINKIWYRILISILSVLLFAYVAYRSIHLSITFDEVWTFDLASQSIWDIMHAEKNFSSANNHILNSILIKPFLSLFGHQVWVLRMPNVLSYLLFLLGSVLVVQQIFTNNILRLVGFILINLQLYCLDFFSLSRGYGLALSFEMMSLSMMILFLRSEAYKYQFLGFLFATLAVMSNFTWLNFFAPLWACMNLIFVLVRSASSQKWVQQIFSFNIAPTFFALILFAFSAYPISILRKQDEFKWGANAWIDSFHTYAKDFNYSNSYPLAIGLQILIFLLFVFSIGILIQSRKQFQKVQILCLATALIFLIVLTTVVQRNVMNTMYMDGRKAIMYTPILMIMVLALFHYFYQKYRMLSIVSASILGLFAGIHFFSIENKDVVREWWFDTKTKSVIEKIAGNHKNQKVSIGMHWFFESGFSYYNRHLYNNQFEPIHVLREEPFADTSQYLYIFSSDVNNFLPNYNVIESFDFGGTVLKRK